MTETVDIVEEYGSTEEELDAMSEEELEKHVGDYWQDWFWEQANGGFGRKE